MMWREDIQGLEAEENGGGLLSAALLYSYKGDKIPLRHG